MRAVLLLCILIAAFVRGIAMGLFGRDAWPRAIRKHRHVRPSRFERRRKRLT